MNPAATEAHYRRAMDMRGQPVFRRYSGSGNARTLVLSTLTTWRLLNGLDGTTPWNGNVPLISLGQAA